MKIPFFSMWLAAAILIVTSPIHSQDAPPDVAAPPEDAAKTASGLASKVLTKGTGEEKPAPWDTVTVHYSGWTTDGKLFDSSVKGGSPISFPLSGVIRGWTEGLQLMVKGEKRRFWIPPDLAYGENPTDGSPAGMLVFDVELLGIKKGAKPPGPPPADAEKRESGLITKVLEEGSGSTHPNETDIVTAHFTGWTEDGKQIGSSRDKGESVRFPLNRVLKGWTEGIQLMVQGEKRRLWVPEDLAHEGSPRPGAPKGLLIFDVELVKFEKAPEKPKVPEDVGAVPAGAEKTASGLASRVLKEGSGDVHPTASDSVTVHYSGWTKDGKMFDSSVARGEPTSFSLTRVIKGWTEGVQLMVIGEKRRFWIPADLAYGETPSRPGAPAGDLVFDIELISIN